jgi:uncharacterized membrane protein (UPF0127 family)
MKLHKTIIINTLVTLCLLGVFVFVVRPPQTYKELHIEKSDGNIITFNVELAITPEQQDKGLMFREKMPKNEGMLFLFQDENIIEMWMKNTTIPLDMLFITKHGRIKKIVKNTTPNSIKTISSETSVIAVLEINAMLSDELSINENDLVLDPIFDSAE